MTSVFQENGAGPVTSIVPVKIEADDYVDENIAEDSSAVGGETMELLADVSRISFCPSPQWSI